LLHWSDIEFCQSMIKIRPDFIRFVNDQTYELCIQALKIDPLVIEFVINPIEKYTLVCLDDYKELCKYAVENSHHSLSKIKQLSNNIIDISIKIFPYSIKYIKINDPMQYEEYVRINPFVLEFIDMKYWTRELLIDAI